MKRKATIIAVPAPAPARNVTQTVLMHESLQEAAIQKLSESTSMFDSGLITLREFLAVCHALHRELPAFVADELDINTGLRYTSDSDEHSRKLENMRRSFILNTGIVKRERRAVHCDACCEVIGHRAKRHPA